MLKNSVKLGKLTLIFLLAVIAWGAYVRASGSGAGCGSHWPLCNGQVLPLAGSTKTLIEFTHRITSGLSLLLCLALGWSTVKTTRAGSYSRKAGLATVIFIFMEALLGAGLVLLELVEHDKSLLRTLSLGVHLMNTFFLIGSVLLTIRWTGMESHGSRRLKLRSFSQDKALFILSIAS
ncbi:MAG: COX15/CtaA family protein, partial [Bdellovibrio sp.]|nr:COX15/CtaA family protein [Bdellovibrio sp.]